ncbi:MAG: hypothetical protein L3J93_02270 [Thermoplasmata archaeon]|nr:hypothetical protein [Thermoplasmata archaeon]
MRPEFQALAIPRHRAPQNPHCEPLLRSRRQLLAPAIVLLTVLSLLAGPFGGHTSAPLPTWTHPPGGSELLDQARASVASGQAPFSAPPSALASGGFAFPNLASDVALAYDPALSVVVAVAENLTSTGNATDPLETWSFDGGNNWTQLAPSASPSGRVGTTLTYDPFTNALLLFGGEAPLGNYLGDTWSFFGGSWFNITATSGPAPPARASASFAWDGADRYAVLYGGVGANGSNWSTSLGLTPTWTFVAANGSLGTAGAWSSSSQPSKAVPPDFGAMAYDGADGYLLYEGGLAHYHNATAWSAASGTWKFVSGVWTNLSAIVSGSPGHSLLSGLAYDALDGYVLLFGGIDGSNGSGPSNATLTYRAGHWSTLAPGGSPSARTSSNLAYDPATNRVILYGGLGGFGPLGDTWAYAGVRWTFTAPTLWVAGALTGASGAFETDVGLSVALYASGVLTVGSAAYTYTQLPTGCSSVSAPIDWCAPAASGTFAIVVSIYSASGESVTAPLLLTVNPDPKVTAITYSLPASEPGVAFVLTSSALGGSGSLSYAYSGLPAGCVGLNAKSIQCTPTTAGIFPVTASVRDGLGQTASLTAPYQVVPRPFISQAVGSAGRIDLGMPVRFTVLAGGGLGYLAYTYNGLPSGCSPRNASSVVCMPGETGHFTVSITTTDAEGFVAGASIGLIVNPALLEQLTASTTSVTLRSTITLQLALNGGTGPYSVSYTGLPLGCTSANVTQLACTPDATGTFTVTATVSDAAGAVLSSPVTFVVGPYQAPPGGGGSGGSGSSSPFAFLGAPDFLPGFGLGVAVVLAALLAVTERARRSRRIASEGDNLVAGLLREAPGLDAEFGRLPEPGVGREGPG